MFPLSHVTFHLCLYRVTPVLEAHDALPCNKMTTTTTAVRPKYKVLYLDLIDSGNVNRLANGGIAIITSGARYIQNLLGRNNPYLKALVLGRKQQVAVC